jgi:hypothetical protein
VPAAVAPIELVVELTPRARSGDSARHIRVVVDPG